MVRHSRGDARIARPRRIEDFANASLMYISREFPDNAAGVMIISSQGEYDGTELEPAKLEV